MKAKELHYACIEAINQCPQCDYDADNNDAYCKSYKKSHSKGIPLYKKGMFAVISYWRDPETTGGNILWDYGYYLQLPKEAQEIFKKVDEIIETAIKTHFKH